MKGKLSIVRIAGLILAVLQLVLSGILSVRFWDMGFLPTKLWGLLTVALAAAFLLVFVLQFVKGFHWFGKLLSLLIIIGLALGLHYVNQADTTLKEITDKTSIEKDQILVVVKKDSTAQTLDDLKSGNWGIQYANDVELMGKAADKVKEELKTDVKLTAYDDYEALYPALMGGQVDCMIMNSSYMDMIDERTIEEDKYQFSQEIRIIKTLEFETKKEKTAARVKKNFDITKDPFLIYISGIDTYGDISTRSRSDVNILMAVNPADRQILLLTTPRDAYVPLPGVSGGQRDKLTHAGIYGIDCSMDTLNSIYGTDINYYARVNFNSVINIVDALGGIEAYSAYDFNTGEYSFKKGYNHMDGKKALSFSRERHAFGEGDHQRGRDQLEVIKGIVNKCISPAILTGFSGILEEVSSQVQTSLPTKSIYSLVKMQLEDPRGWEMFSYDVQAKGAREYCYSYSGKSLYVGYLVDSSVKQGSNLLKTVLKGDVITQEDVSQ
ncbi:MAG: LCP family protein [Lachnospiraceae bacterium]|nr:LCP family protein [Lachnospiraceae bacterium]